MKIKTAKAAVLTQSRKPLVVDEIALPQELTGANEKVIVQCKGRVVRKDAAGEGGEAPGVACVIDTYDFVRQP